MFLYLLAPISPSPPEWAPWYDKVFGFVIVACDDVQARQCASQNAGDEGGDVWKDPAKSLCEIIGRSYKTTEDGSATLVLRDYRSA